MTISPSVSRMGFLFVKFFPESKGETYPEPNQNIDRSVPYRSRTALNKTIGLFKKPHDIWEKVSVIENNAYFISFSTKESRIAEKTVIEPLESQ